MPPRHLPGRTDLAARMREGRLERGWNKTAAARAAGVSRNTWQNLEAGVTSTPRDDTVSKILAALEPDPPSPPGSSGLPVLSALQKDPLLNNRGREVLSGLYEFVIELSAQARSAPSRA